MLSQHCLERKEFIFFFNQNTNFWKWKNLISLSKQKSGGILFEAILNLKTLNSLEFSNIQTHAQVIQWIFAYSKMHILNYSTKHNHHLVIALHQFNGWTSQFTYYLAGESIIYLDFVVFQQTMFKSWLLVYTDALKVTVHCRLCK